MTLVPAYGRDYKSKKEVEADWAAGKDFIVASVDGPMGKYLNINDARQWKIDEVGIRYARCTKIALIRVKP